MASERASPLASLGSGTLGLEPLTDGQIWSFGRRTLVLAIGLVSRLLVLGSPRSVGVA